MGDIIFVEPGYHYQPYDDYFRLVELAGYPVISIGAVDVTQPATYIMTMLNLDYYAEAGGWPDGRARVIYWDLEWRDPSYIGKVPGIQEYWTSDRHYATQRGYQYVPLGSHPELVRVKADRRWHGVNNWDVCMLAYLSGRRQHLPDALRARRLRVAPTSAWGEERDFQLERSRCMLTTHQLDNYPCIAAQRWALAATAAMPLIAEHPADPGIFRPDVHYIGAAMADIPDVTQAALSRHGTVALGRNLHELLCDQYPFKLCVERALQGVEVTP